MSRFRLNPAPSQELVLMRHCADARFVWNLAVEQWKNWRPGRRSAPGYHEQARQLTEARAEFGWLAQGAQVVQQQALRDFKHATAAFFAGKHGLPSWRKAGRNEGFRIVGRDAQKVRRCSRKVGEVWIPKAGWVRFRWSRQVGLAKSYRVSRDRSGRWHVAFAVVPAPIPAPGNGRNVGVDRGVVVSAALSTGELLTVPLQPPQEVSRLKRLQRRMAKAEPGSRRRERLRQQAAKLIARQADRRKDWVEKTTTWLARSFDVIAIEDLKVKSMTRSAARGRGGLDTGAGRAQSGALVAAKTALNRAILATGWGQLADRLEEKAPGRVIRVDPARTSQRCSRCGEACRDSRESQAVFRCTSCGYSAHADVNAAVNIRDRAVGHTAAGRAVAARGGGPVGQPVNREPQFSHAHS